MRPLIEFCVNNLTGDMLDLKKELEMDRSFDVLEYGCLGFCGLCAAQPYAMVEGEVISGDTADDLMNNIKNHIKKLDS